MKLSLRTKLTSCVLVVGTALACCLSRNSLAALNTSEDFLVKGQPALVSSPRIVVFSTNSLVVGTNRLNLGLIPSYAAAEYTVKTLIESSLPIPVNATWQISTNGGTTWQTPFKTAQPVLLSVYAGGADTLITNITVYGYSVKFGATNSLTGQTILVDKPETGLAAANKQYVDDSLVTYNPTDWAVYPAVDTVNVAGQGVILNDAFSIETANGSLRSASVKAFGTDLLKFESSSITSGSNVTSQIVVTTTNVTIKVASSGITSRPVVFHKYNLDDPQWQLVSSITNVTENYPTPSGGFYTITFGRIAGDNWFTVFLESTNTTRRVTVSAPFYIAAGGTVTGDFAIQDGGLEVGNGIDAGGLISSTTGFSGPGSGLTGIPASGLAAGGTLPVLNAINLTNIPASGLAKIQSATNAVAWFDSNGTLRSTNVTGSGSVVLSNSPTVNNLFGIGTNAGYQLELYSAGNVPGAGGWISLSNRFKRYIYQQGNGGDIAIGTSLFASDGSLTLESIALTSLGRKNGSETMSFASGSISFNTQLRHTNGFVLASNILATWPATPPSPGSVYWANSNGVLYVLYSTNGSGGGSTSWTKTNYFGP